MATLPHAQQATPAKQLMGVTLPSGWKLVEMLQRQKGGSGSNFGTGYKAERIVKTKTEFAFVKAIDFVSAMNSTDPVVELMKLTTEANFERQAMELCDEKRLSRLIKLISWEYINQHPTKDLMHQVLCLVMEVGEGDIRRQVTRVGALPSSVILHVLEDIALGLAQLHRHGIAHQDVKPSNVISMSDIAKKNSNLFKIADLGRVVRRGVQGPYDHYQWPGDKNYAPPERWYSYVPAQWPDAREASDAYMLGSLACFLFSGVPMQTLLYKEIPAAMLPGTWVGGYNDSLLQVLRAKQSSVLANTIAPYVNAKVRDGVINLIRELIDPDPLKRGDRRSRSQTGSPGIDRYQSRLKMLRLQAEIAEKFNNL